MTEPLPDHETPPPANGLISAPPAMTFRQTILICLFSAVVLGLYLTMNALFSPGYPVINEYAEKSRAFAAHYPPFRMNEWLFYQITDEFITGESSGQGSLARRFPVGYALLAAPFVRQLGDDGMFYVNALLMWGCAVLFFLVARRAAVFSTAVFWTAVLAFASPNLFFAASAYGEPLSQFLLMCTLLFLLRAMEYDRQKNISLTVCGAAAGMHLFAIPYFTLTILIAVAGMVIHDRRRMMWRKHLAPLAGGFFGVFVFFILMNVLLLHTVPRRFFFLSGYLDIFETESMYYSGTNPIVSFLKMIFDSPHGILFIMPLIMVIPSGVLSMWRRKNRSAAIGTLILIALVLLFSSLGGTPVSGEVVGTRQLAMLIPFLLFPLTFLKNVRTGEKIWLGLLLALTVYQCSFGWWLGTAKGEGVFTGILNDREARFIMLAREDMLKRPVFGSTQEVTETFRESLRRRDIKRWLQTLDSQSITDITGFERIVFTRLIRDTGRGSHNIDTYIRSVDPDRGIHLDIPSVLLTDPSGSSGGVYIP